MRIVYIEQNVSTDIIISNASRKDGANDFTHKKRIEITVDVGCASPGVTFTWSRPDNARDIPGKHCDENPYFITYQSILRIDNLTEDDAGEITLSITHHKLGSGDYTWRLCK